MQKIPLSILRDVVGRVESWEDAGVLDGRAYSADFGPALVDDGFLWGMLAAAHSVTDIYATGALPDVALGIAGWPSELLPSGVMREALRGAEEWFGRRDVLFVGGHSMDSIEPFLGFSVAGSLIGTPWSSAGLQHGDSITLSKPMGSGWALLEHRATGEPLADEVLSGMLADSGAAVRQASSAGCQAASDVSGFGLVGQLALMARASGVTIVLREKSVPLYAACSKASLTSQRGTTVASRTRNYENIASVFRLAGDLRLSHMFDAEVAGGLLLANFWGSGCVIADVQPREEVDVRIV